MEMKRTGVELALRGVAKSYGERRILREIDLEAERDRILALLGPSGCGKTTLLSLIAGLTRPDAGTIEGLHGKAISFAFQEPRLLDWLTAAENVAFVLRDLMPKNEAVERAERVLDDLGLRECRASHPRRLSGGQKQRVAMARALAYPSRLLLLDEPFKSLDPAAKMEAIRQFLRYWEREPRTVILVTHDVQEALLLADRIAVLADKPTFVRKRLDLAMPREARRLDDLSLLRLEREILAELLGSGLTPPTSPVFL